MSLEVSALCFSYTQEPVLRGVSFKVETGKITALVGRNGCGKSTTLKIMARLLDPASGQVLLNGKSVHQQDTREVAKLLALLPQSPSAPSSLTVRSLVAMGRYPHQNLMGRLNAEDHEAVERALQLTGLKELAERRLHQLSGGQRQRAWLAVALAQETDILLLDEPTTYLDMAHQLEVLELLKRLNEEQGKTIVMVVHDLNHATQYADYLVALKGGLVGATGSPGEILDETFFAEIFGIRAQLLEGPRAGKPLCVAVERLTGEQEAQDRA